MTSSRRIRRSDQLITCILPADQPEAFRQLRAAGIAAAMAQDLILVDEDNPTVEYRMHGKKRFMAATWQTIARSSLAKPAEFNRDGRR